MWIISTGKGSLTIFFVILLQVSLVASETPSRNETLAFSAPSQNVEENPVTQQLIKPEYSIIATTPASPYSSSRVLLPESSKSYKRTVVSTDVLHLEEMGQTNSTSVVQPGPSITSQDSRYTTIARHIPMVTALLSASNNGTEVVGVNVTSSIRDATATVRGVQLIAASSRRENLTYVIKPSSPVITREQVKDTAYDSMVSVRPTNKTTLNATISGRPINTTVLVTEKNNMSTLFGSGREGTIISENATTTIYNATEVSKTVVRPNLTISIIEKRRMTSNLSSPISSPYKSSDITKQSSATAVNQNETNVIRSISETKTIISMNTSIQEVNNATSYNVQNTTNIGIVAVKSVFPALSTSHPNILTYSVSFANSTSKIIEYSFNNTISRSAISLGLLLPSGTTGFFSTYSPEQSVATTLAVVPTEITTSVLSKPIAKDVVSHTVQDTSQTSTGYFTMKVIRFSTMLPSPESTKSYEKTVVSTSVSVKPSTNVKEQEFLLELRITSELFTEELLRRSSKAFRQKSREIEQKLDIVYKDMPGYSYSKVVRFFKGSLGCEVVIFVESFSRISPKEIEEPIIKANSSGNFGGYVVSDIKVQAVKQKRNCDEEKKKKEGKTWGFWPVIVISILAGVGLVLLVIVITQCIQKRYYIHSLESSNLSDDSPSAKWKVEHGSYRDEEQIPMTTFSAVSNV